MKKVLLIEDNALQIEWAKKQIGERCELIIARSIKESSQLRLDIMNGKLDVDYIITDLELPYKEGDQPSAQQGFDLFDNIMRYALEKIKGIAIVSNFEHHVRQRDEEGNKEMYDVLEQLTPYRRLSAKVCCRTYCGYPEEMEEKIKKEGFCICQPDRFGASGLVVLVDAIQIGDYPYYWHEGEAKENGAIEKRERYNLTKSGKAIPLKPYSQVLDYFESLD